MFNGTHTHLYLGFDAFGDVLQPQNVSTLIQNQKSLMNSIDMTNNNNGFNNMFNNHINNNNHIVPTISSSTTIMPSSTATLLSSSTSTSSSVPTSSSNPTTGILVKGDLDATLASLAQNLDINGLKGAGNYKRFVFFLL